MSRICEADCDRPVHAKGLCVPHYRRMVSNGPNFDSSPIRPYIFNGEKCNVDWCESKVVSKTLCETHYSQVKRHGRLLPKHEKLKPNSRVCAESGCKELTTTKKSSRCNEHIVKYSQEPEMVDFLGGVWKIFHMNSNGYRVRYTINPDGSKTKRGEHRLVMEQMLGRELTKGENVHHLNGIRWDNRPENLEIWIKPQPNGARLSDLLDWARTCLAKYGEEWEMEAFNEYRS